jgi:hypothetical protein
MVEVSKAIKTKIEQSVKEYFLSAVTDRFSSYKSMLKQLSNVFETTGVDTTEKRKKANEQIKKLIEYNYNFKLNNSFKDEFTSYHYSIDALLSQVKEEFVEEQLPEHFKKQDTDTAVIGVAKSAKWALQNLNWAGLAVANVFRKQNKPKKYFDRNIPLHGCYRYFIKIRFSKHLLEMLENAENKLLQIIDQADTFCRSVTQKAANPLANGHSEANQESLKDLAAQIETLKNDLVDEVNHKLEQEFRLLQTALNKAGTIELNASFFSHRLNKRRELQIELQYGRWTRRIARNHKILKDNWILSHEINIFYESLKLASKKVCDRLNHKVQVQLFNQLERIAKHLNESYESFIQSHEDKELLKAAILKERSRINGNFKKTLIPNSVQMMLFQNLPTVTLALDQDFERALTAISAQVSIKRNFKVDEKLRENEINTINPSEIISFEYFDDLQLAKENLHTELVQLNNRIQPSIIEISNIHAYTFETAINNLENNTASLKEIDETIKQGFERTFEKIEALKTELLEVAEKATLELDKALNILNKDLQYLNNTDSAFELNVKLLESKARLRTKSYRTKIFNSVSVNFKRFIAFVRKQYRQILSLYKTTEQSLTTIEAATIDNNLAAFLNNAKQSFDKLPFIYRLLFRLEPLDDFNFYIDRNQELRQLKTAYENWENGHVGSSLLIGPKRSGLTSLFNKFEDDLSDDIQVNRIVPKKNIASTAQLIELLKSTFNQSKFENSEDVANYLVNCGIKRVVLIDEFQRFFLRRVNGFEILNELQKVIRISQDQVFWVVNLAEISANYLRKTTSIHEFFAWNIPLQALNQKQVKQLIMKRHLVSGFKLIYSDSIAPKTAKLSKMNSLEKQTYLENLYFEKLTKMAEGSLGLALLLWVLSIDSIDKQSLQVNPLVPVNDVLRGVESNKLSILHALVLHDGLGIKELNEVLNFHISKTRNLLSSLEKDGVVENKNDFLKINPLLHWSAVNAMNKRNVIH